MGERTFQESKIVQVSINSNKIQNYAFLETTSLEKAIIGKNVTSLGYGIFGGCNKLNILKIFTEKAGINNFILQTGTALKEIEVNDDNSKYMVEDGILFSKDGSKIYAYPTGKEGETYVFPNSVKEIGDSAFYICKNLKNISVPSTIEEVGERAF